MLETRLTDRLGIEFPIVQAPIGSATCPELAAAVSEAGGLGTLAVTWRDLDEAKRTIRETARRTDRPFGVNVVLDPAAKALDTDRQIDACLEAGAEIVSLSFGDAAPHVGRLHDAGALALQTVGSAAEARRAVEAGVDVVVAQGWEAGGHVQSEVATLPLVPRVVDAVPETPVIAAGGIADGRGVAAALTLGADGAWLGTRFVATREAQVHERYKRRVREAEATDTEYTDLFDVGWPDQPHRVLRNETIERWEKAGRPPAGDRPGEGEAVAEYPDGTEIERYDEMLPLPGMDGDLEELPHYAGQGVGLAHEIDSAADLVERLAAETEDALATATASGTERDYSANSS